MGRDELVIFLKDTAQKIVDLLEEEIRKFGMTDPSFREAVLSYFRRPAKMMRPGALLLSCGASGGEPKKTLRIAAGLEVHHVFTLVHDDIMDRSEERRGGPTLHKLFEREAREIGVPDDWRAFFGQNMAILAGDLQGSWGVHLFLSAAEEGLVSFELVNKLLSHFERVTLSRIIEGQVLDLKFEHQPLNEISREEILRMVSFKTAELFRFAGLGGAILALNQWQLEHPWVTALSEFCFKVGMGFQIYDDLSDLLEEAEASDIRSGKRTLLSWYIYSRAGAEDRKFLDEILGKEDASADEIERVRQKFEDLGVREYVRNQVDSYINEAKEKLEPLPDSPYKNLLYDWADFARSHREA